MDSTSLNRPWFLSIGFILSTGIVYSWYLVLDMEFVPIWLVVFAHVGMVFFGTSLLAVTIVFQIHKLGKKESIPVTSATRRGLAVFFGLWGAFLAGGVVSTLMVLLIIATFLLVSILTDIYVGYDLSWLWIAIWAIVSSIALHRWLMQARFLFSPVYLDAPAQDELRSLGESISERGFKARDKRVWRKGSFLALAQYAGTYLFAVIISLTGIFFSLLLGPFGSIAIILLAPFCIPVLGGMVDRSKQRFCQFTAPTISVVLEDARAPIAIFRSHQDEDVLINVVVGSRRNRSVERFEEFVCSLLAVRGPCIAIGMPGEPLPRLGAAREYFSYREWKDSASGFMENAAMLVFIAGPTEGLKWEFSEAVRRGLARNSIVLIPPNRVFDSVREAQMFGISFAGKCLMKSDHILAVAFNKNGEPMAVRSRSSLSIAYADALNIAVKEVHRNQALVAACPPPAN